MDKDYELSDLVYLMQRLRDPESGCPWDIKQTFDSIVPVSYTHLTLPTNREV